MLRILGDGILLCVEKAVLCTHSGTNALIRKGINVNIIDVLEQEQMRQDIPSFNPGDTVKVHVKIIEGGRERIQIFEGIVIRRQGGGLRETFTVRKLSSGIGVERTFPVHSPKIDKIEKVRSGLVRRAKLYYLRERSGKSARIKEARR